jgi:O-antigen/teichoic acid export membrane protein
VGGEPRGSAHPGAILRPFVSLVGAQAIGSALGFVFWVLAARLGSTETVGVAAAAISAQTLLGTLATMGLGTLLIGELRRVVQSGQRRLLVVALSTAGLAGLAFAGVTLLLTPLINGDLHEALADPGTGSFYAVGASVTAVGMVLDQCVLGLDRSSLQVWRNLLASGLRFPLVLLLAQSGDLTPFGLLLSWVVPLVLSVVFVWVALRLPRERSAERTGTRELLGVYWRPALSNHGLNLSLGAGPLLVPVVAGVILIPVDNAEFAIAWLIATFVFTPPYMLATALFAATVNTSPELFRATVRRTLPSSLALSLALCIASWTLGPFFLRIFGEHYAENSAPILNLLVVGGLWMVVKDHMVAYARVTSQLGVATRLAGVAVGLELVGAVAGGLMDGSRGVALGWLVALCIQVVVGTPIAWRTLHGTRQATPPASGQGTGHPVSTRQES